MTAAWRSALLLGLMLSCPAFASAGGVVREGPKACKAIALTFDLCPVREGTGYDRQLIETLVERHIPATFFLSGRWIAKHDEEVRALLRVPFFEVGTHGQVHAHLPELDQARQEQEIKDAVTVLRARYGHAAVLFRPPYGEFNGVTEAVAEALGLRFILWNIVSGDPDPHLSRVQIVQRVESRVRNGSIIVMHANGKGRYTRDVVDDLYEDLIQRQGYRPVTVTTLLDQCPADPAHDAGHPPR
ncbi:polysaccharide deacetylase family protein [Candidatus Nitrospira bockiana]